MDRALIEKKIRKRLARAKGGHKRVLEARLAKLVSVPEPVAEVVKAPAQKKKKAAKKK